MIDDALGRLDDAAKVYEQLAAATEHPSGQYSDDEKGNYATMLVHLAEVYREQSRPEQAIATYEKMVALGGDLPAQAYDQEVETWREAHDYDKAVAVAKTAVDKLPKNVGAKLTLARQLADTGHADEGHRDGEGPARERSEEYGDLLPAGADLYRSAEVEGCLRRAGRCWEAVSQKKDDQTMVLFDRAMMADRAKRYDEAEADFRKVLAVDPDNALTLNNFGFMLADRGVKLDEALTMIRKAVQLEPTNYAYLDSLGWTYFRMGQYAQAEDNLTRAISRGRERSDGARSSGRRLREDGAAEAGSGAVGAFAQRVRAHGGSRHGPGRRRQGAEEAGQRAGTAGPGIGEPADGWQAGVAERLSGRLRGGA